MSAIFRKTSLERLSSPEQLDQLLQAVRPSGWIALASLLALLGAALLWAWFGSIPTEARGAGLLLRQGGVTDLVATGNGQIDEVLVAVGDLVRKGQEVARIRQQGLSRQLDEGRARRAAIAADYQRLLAFAAEQERLSSGNLVQKRRNLERTIETLERDLGLLGARIEAQRALLADGLITEQTLLTSEQEANRLRDQLATQRLELSGLDLVRLEDRQDLAQRIEQREAELREQDLKLREVAASLTESVTVISSHDGRVLERMVDRGDVVTPGAPILSIEMQSEELLAVLFVPAEQGKLVRPGMAVRVSPSNVRQEEHGFLLGRVRWVADYPSSSRGMERLLGNQDLVGKLVEAGPPIQIDVALERDARTPTGFAWSSARGPEITITSGTLASGRVLIREERPITLLLPKAKAALGL
jgi:HlyD family secretion protein